MLKLIINTTETDLISTGAGIEVDVVQFQELHTKWTLQERDNNGQYLCPGL